MTAGETLPLTQPCARLRPFLWWRARMGMQLNWREISGPALAAATALIAIFVDRHFLTVPNPAPLLVCIVAFAGSLSGLGSAMASAVIAVISAAVFFFDHRAT